MAVHDRPETPATVGGREHPVVELELTRLISNIDTLDAMIARMDGVINLLKKAVRATERGEPGDRARALSLVDRAERYLPDEGEVPEEHRPALDEMRTSVVTIRQAALDLPE